MQQKGTNNTRNSVGKKPRFLIVWTSSDSSDIKTFVSQYSSIKKHAEDLKRAETVRVFNAKGDLLSFADKRFNICTSRPYAISGEFEAEKYAEMFRKCYEETTGKTIVQKSPYKIIVGSDGSQYSVKRKWYSNFVREHPECKSKKRSDDLLFFAFRAMVASGLEPFEPKPEQ